MYERLVLIGAGSAVFTRMLIADLICLHWSADVALVDIDPAALDVAHRLASKMVAAPMRRLRCGCGRCAWAQDVSIPRQCERSASRAGGLPARLVEWEQQ